LRRVELPIDEIKKQAAAEGKVDHVKITAELAGAEFDASIDGQKFQLDAPPTAQTVKMLVPPEPAQLLSKKLPAFKFYDLAAKPVTPESVAGKVLVIDFWGSNCPPCRASMPNLEKVYQKYKSNPKVAFLCVNVDPPATKNDAVAALFKELGSTAPLVRDTEGQIMNLFFTSGIPAMFLVGADGVVEDFEAGANPDLVTALPAKIEKLLAGQHLYEQALKEYQQRLQNAEEAAARGPEAKPEAGQEIQRELPATKIAEASQPKTLKLKSLWKSTDVKSPGNLLVVPRADGTPRILVINEWRTVAELGPDGKLVTTHALDLPGPEVVSFLRTIEAGGKRWFAASTVGMQQVHVYDETWKALFHFPQDALENKHAGIFDALLADVNGDGKPLLAVGYWGPVGVQGVSLEGKRLWSNRSMENVFRLATTAKDSAGKRSLLCLNSRGTVVVLDGEGNRKDEIAIGSRPVQLLVGADLAGNSQPQYCGLAAKQVGVYVALGLDLRGKELWSYDLPPGHPSLPVEQIIAGQITPALPGQWILPAADGSIHILAADGKPIDRFNYGAPLCGVGTAQIAGRPALVVASPTSIEALEVLP
jgi:thiol-disulfide isomerase/thioredoxin